MEVPRPRNIAARSDTLRGSTILNILSEESFDDLTHIAAHLCDTPLALIHFIKNNRHAVKSVVGLESKVDLSDLPFFSHAILEQDIFVVPDASADERFSANPLVMSGPQIRFYAGAPLITARREVLGTLCVMDFSPKALNPDQIESLRMLARQVIRRIDLWSDLVELKRSVNTHKLFEERLAAEHAIADVLAQAKTLSDTLPRILQVVCESLGWNIGLFWRVNDPVNVLTCVEIWQANSMDASEFEAVSRKSIFWPDEGLPGRVWTRGELDWISDVADEKRFKRASLAAKEGLHGAFAFPVRGQHKVLGVMEFFCRDRREPDDNLLELMSNLGTQIGRFIEQKRVEENVIQSAAIVESFENAIIGTTLDGIITNWNRGAEKAFGYSAEKVLGQPIAILFLPDRLNEFSEVLERIKRGERVDRYESVYVKENGECIDVSLAISPIKDDTGKTMGALSIKRDLTKRKRVEEALRESAARFRRLAESSILGLLFWDVHGNITDANDAFLKMVGYTRDDLLSGKLQWPDMTPEEYRPLDERALQELTATGACTPFEKEYFRKDGSRIPILIGKAFLGGSQDRGICFVLDLTDRKEMEKALLESEARKEAILESSLDCIITIDQEGKIVEFNPAAEYTFGYSSSEVIGKEMMELMISPPLRERLRNDLAHYLVSGESRVLYRRIEITAMRADGSEFSAELKITRTFLKGSLLFAISVRDISERKWIEQERNRLLIQERLARTQAEEARQHMAFLAEASRLLSSSEDYEATLSQLARLIVPYLADGCVVDILEEDRTVRRVAVAATDPSKEELGRELIRRYPPDPNGLHPLERVLQTGKSMFLPQITDEILTSIARDEEHLRIARSLGLKSAIIVPLLAGERTLGAISLVMTDSNRRYRPEDLAIAEDMARRVGIAVDNARLYRKAQEEIKKRKQEEDHR